MGKGGGGGKVFIGSFFLLFYFLYYITKVLNVHMICIRYLYNICYIYGYKYHYEKRFCTIIHNNSSYTNNVTMYMYNILYKIHKANYYCFFF